MDGARDGGAATARCRKLGVRNIEGYNQRVEQAAAKGETLTRKVQTGFDPETGAPIYEEQAFDLAPCPSSWWWSTRWPT